ncbi:hypothetical protein [Marinisporobacter balticus]|uniref:Uncharacterized protein n=1 Tax=Marinisporobacter balticus TaxID=2018667 RepID=A0A4V2S9H0_9FIRM|nr:hypothetical protein [Marinisporobacter balticus]TCO67910.1 hypothetical protein EV214_1512 [Marinisporobacter balticus]
MEYFVMKYDDRVLSPIKIDLSTIDIDAKEASVAYAMFHENTTFVDYFYIKKLFKYNFCVSDELKELLDIYADEMTAIPLFITDKKQENQKVYWKIDIEVQDCLEMKPHMKYDDLTIIQDKMKNKKDENKKDENKNKYIFKVLFEKQEYLIVSLHLAENILRKNLCGMQFIPVKLK